MVGWNPWKALRGRPHLRLNYANMHPSRGRIVDHANGMRTITLDRRLSQVERSAVLAHELVHDEYDLLWPPGTPEGIVQKGERFVQVVSDDRLVPPAELAEFIAKRSEVGMVVSWMVAEEFEVPPEVAMRCMDRLAAGF